MPDDEVIDATDSDQSARFDHSFRDFDIFPARRRIAGRMIMDRNEACRRTTDGFPKYVARVNNRCIEPSDKQRFLRNDLIFCIQVQADEVFLLIEPHLFH